MEEEEGKKPEKAKRVKKKKNFSAKSESFKYRISPEKKALWLKQMQEAGIKKLAVFLRNKIDNGTLYVRYVDSKYEKLIFELNKIGLNINQLTAQFHRTGDPVGVGEELSKTLIELKSLLSRAQDKLNAEDKPLNLKKFQ